MRAAPSKFISPFGLMSDAHLFEPDPFGCFKVSLSYTRTEGDAFERKLSELAGDSDRDLKFSDTGNDLMTFRFVLQSHVRLHTGRYLEQRPHLYGPDDEPANLFKVWSCEQGRVAGELWIPPEPYNPILRVKAFQFSQRLSAHAFAD
ncbi:MAG: hypothetical protein QNJ14_04275 [Woeseiaceae bacterium]|nr:hypothetical protein [Woeseiaceae bacterium]